MPVFKLTLQKTYYDKGFFNVSVDFEQSVRTSDGPVDLVLDDDRTVNARVSRTANLNGTPRIYGGSALRDWFQKNFRVMDQVAVDLGSKESIRLYRPRP